MEAYPEWIHCNNCFYQPISPDQTVRFYLTSCGHIFCINCINSPADNICKLCSNRGSAIEINKKMRPDIYSMFLNPVDLIQAKFQELAKIFKFQNGHYTRLEYIHKNRLADASKISELKTKYEHVCKENQILKQKLNQILHRKTDDEKSINHTSNSPSIYTHAAPTIIRSNRLTLRTPPVDGKIGTIPTPYHSSRDITPSITKKITSKLKKSNEKERLSLKLTKYSPPSHSPSIQKQDYHPPNPRNKENLNTYSFLVTPNFKRKP